MRLTETQFRLIKSRAKAAFEAEARAKAAVPSHTCKAQMVLA